MNTYFFDTSAIVRLYTTEVGARFVRDILRSTAHTPPTASVVVCDLARPETFAALRRISLSQDAARRGLSPAALRLLLPQVRHDFGEQERFSVISSSPCMQLAADIAARHTIKGADAVHVASALIARTAYPAPERFYFVSEDAGQSRVAEAEGLQVLRPAA